MTAARPPAREPAVALGAAQAVMGIAGLGVSRWQLMSAPRRIELSPDLEAALAPLRRR
ncbi:hypothetical protein [Solirubrobacter pauli]|nr:hypothetical protein [Solirubrobacter pauli]